MTAAPGGGDVGGGNVAWYQFDEDGGATAADSSGLGNDASILLAESAATWQDVTVDLNQTVGTFPLYLVFPDAQVRVNWMEFGDAIVDPGACPDPDQRETVIIGDVDSGVPNYDAGDGCTINDLILDEQSWTSKRAFTNHVREVTTQLTTDGVITSREARLIVRAANRSTLA
jgi:hypothetical protein